MPNLTITTELARAAGVDITTGDAEQYSVQMTDDGKRIHRDCRGEYTIEEMRGMLADMEALQSALDAGKLGGALVQLTAFELAVLTAIDKSEYGDYLTDDIWTFSLADNMPEGGPVRRQIAGTVSSLVKKGLAGVGGSGKDQTVGMTRAGIVAYVAARGAAVKKRTGIE